jgi:hypothetical protein
MRDSRTAITINAQLPWLQPSMGFDARNSNYQAVRMPDLRVCCEKIDAYEY